MRRFRSRLLISGGLFLAACGDNTEETVQLKGIDSVLVAKKNVDSLLRQVDGKTDSVFEAVKSQSFESVLGRVAVGSPIQVLRAIIGTGPMKATGADTLQIQDGFRRTLVVVAPDLYTVIWFRKEPGTPRDPISRSLEAPIVLKNELVIGTGWAFYDQNRAALQLPVVATP
jgi:hypothetical protein